MADPRFFLTTPPKTLAELAGIAEAKLADGTNPDQLIADVATLETAGPEHIAFIANRRYVRAFTESKAGAFLVEPTLVERAPAGMAVLVCDKPRRAFARIAAAFHPEETPEATIHPTALIDPSARIGRDVGIEAHVVIAANVSIGDGCRIGANTVIERGVELGAGCVIGNNATLSYCLIGARVQIASGAVIGNTGFGYDLDASGRTKVPHLGRVIIEDDVEIGANTTIDRGSGPDTVIGRGTVIDNLVMIAHNVRIGRGCILVAQAGVAGSSILGDYVTLAGQVGVANHSTIGDRAVIAGKSGVLSHVPAGAVYAGYPAMPIREWRRLVGQQRLAYKGKGSKDE
ncbi:UDP-3-O-(3-hydroxymyristoyl)glucosamine N-acyltransferase [Oceanibaculum pacificum]|uniref:UDP-3-O-acylglucosamine N-acyltransferase n=1 Tax=Oceanibaculum pacificum TaxID=580166 RepID=A0A154W121_9PROT|nr:UDP-3-O-(3-hydroxymyristoyl)glucosamine N-acyltransferase [Oceanibaculum pacificum]KZD07189.1 UDP-3-O-(3-hydroxymyristoyl)glucosamine N-acyltransferase [Oceanibaculum pacificum]